MADWILDDGYYIDLESGTEIVAEAEFQETNRYTHIALQDGEVVIKSELTLKVDAAVAMDLTSLVPQKFLNSQILLDFLAVAGIEVGTQLTLVREITKLLNLGTLGSVEYMRHLGALIGVEFPPEDETSEAEIKKTLIQAIDWYKVKGTYHSLQILALIQQLTLNIWDLYTKDYTTFYEKDWFVGDENENPAGLDNSYYKSPHFGVEVVLNRVYGISPKYLWKADYLNNLVLRVEETRPVHTVPYFSLLLNPKTDEFGNVIEVDGEIKAKVQGVWQYTTKYFDMIESDNEWDFDESIYFDESSEAFAKSINKWVIGTGSYPCSIGETSGSVDVENPVLDGLIDADDIKIEDDKIVYQFTIPKAIEQNNISELGLYIPGSSDQLMVFSCFPKINKDSRVGLNVEVEVYKEDLS